MYHRRESARSELRGSRRSYTLLPLTVSEPPAALSWNSCSSQRCRTRRHRRLLLLPRLQLRATQPCTQLQVTCSLAHTSTNTPPCVTSTDAPRTCVGSPVRQACVWLMATSHAAPPSRLLTSECSWRQRTCPPSSGPRPRCPPSSRERGFLLFLRCPKSTYSIQTP